MVHPCCDPGQNFFFQLGLIFDLADSKGHGDLPEVGGRHPTHGALEHNKRQKREKFTVFAPASLSELARVISSSMETRISTVGSHGSESFRLRLNYITGCSGTPAYAQQMVGLVSLHHLHSIPHNPSPFVLLSGNFYRLFLCGRILTDTVVILFFLF